MTHSEALYNLKPLTRFTDKAENYAKYRPTYPEAVIDQILEGLGSPSQLVAADVGAGTGISANQLAKRGVNVIAIEPNAAMRDAGRNFIPTDEISTDGISKDATSTDATCPVSTSKSLVEWRDGTAEATNLPDGSVDLITCFQSFHWFKPEPTLSEFRRILKSSGRLALVFNDLDDNNEFTKEYHELISIAANNRPPIELSTKVQPLRENPQWRYLQCDTCIYQQELDLNELIGLGKSVSFISSEEKTQKQLLDDLKDLYQRFSGEHGFVNLGYRASVHIADLNSYYESTG